MLHFARAEGNNPSALDPFNLQELPNLIKDNKIEPMNLETLLEKRKWTVLTGAGVSTNAGIPDFATVDKQWPFELRRERLISKQELYHRDSQRFWEAYRYLFTSKSLAGVTPTAFHRVLSDLEELTDLDLTIITQNIDGLHTVAGSTNVLEIHGNAETWSCSRYRKSCKDFTISYSEIYNEDETPACPKCGRLLRPDVVLFGDQVNHRDEIKKLAKESDLFLIAGTALDVYPAAHLPMIAKESPNSALTVWANKARPSSAEDIDLQVIGDLDDFAENLRSTL